MYIAGIQVAFDYGAGESPEEREIIRNVRMILASPIGSCPMYRDFGIDASIVDKPLNVAQNLYAVNVMETVEKYEPRVSVRQVLFEPDQNGRLEVKVVISRE